ncbi:MAG TPA: efflux RND transporter periplasmic adaptor subunit [Desulfomonilia bacterium]
MKYYYRVILSLTIGAMVLAFSGCGSKDESNRKDANSGKAEVVVAKVERGTILKEYSAMGTIAAEDVARIFPKVAGRVLKIYVTEGSPVGAGQILMQINDSDYRIMVQGVAAMAKGQQVKVEKSKRDFLRAESLHKEDAIAEQLYQDAKSGLEGDQFVMDKANAELANAKKNVSECRVVSPISGIVTSKFVNEGELTAPQSPTPAFVVENMNRVKLEIDLSEDAFGYLEVGNKCIVTVDAIPDKSFEGTISKIFPSINSVSKTFKVTITIENPDLKLRSGMTARAQIVQKARNDAVNAPKVAFLPGEEGFYVFKISGGKVIKTPVKIGIEGNDSYEVLNGLVPGDYVVVEGQVGLSDGLMVKATLAPSVNYKSAIAPAPVAAGTAAVQQQKSPVAPSVNK